MKKNNFWVRVIAMVLVICMAPAITSSAHPFTDVANGSWYSEAVDYVYDHNLMNGTSTSTFSPEGTMNRAMIVTVLHRMAGSPVVNGSIPFVDVPNDTFYSDAVVWAYHNNIVNGVSDTEFAPNTSINRAQLVTMFYRYYNVAHTTTEYADLSKYTDSNQIPAYAYEAFQWAVAAGIINGVTSTTLGASSKASRAQCAVIIKRFSEAVEKNPAMDYSLRLNASTIDMTVDETTDVSVVYDGPWVLAWESSDETVVTIYNGIVTAVSAGTAYITVTDGVKKAQCRVTVENPVIPPEEYELKMNKNKIYMMVGDITTMEYIYTGTNSLTWKSSHEHIATVSQNGEVTAIAEGTAYITVMDGSKNATCKVIVESVPSLTVNVTETTMTVGSTYQVDYTYTGDETNLTWRSRNEDVATVDSNGVVTAVAEGNSIIVVSDGNTSKQCKIKVVQGQVMAEEIEIVNTDGPFYNEVIRYKDDYVVLTLANLPNEATQEVFATSNNTDIVTVSVTNVNGGFCKITLNFKSAGTATITLTSGDGAVSQSYTITVKDGYDFDPGDRQLTPEEFADYTTKVMCANGFEKTTSSGSWRQLTRSVDELTFDQAMKDAYSFIHSWWPNGCRYCQIVYVGQNDNGDYVFQTYWAHG